MAIAGLVVNGAGALLVIAVARLVTPQAYGAIAQLLGLFFILSMPGSAVLVGVVRRVTALQNAGRGPLVKVWVGKVHRILLVALAVEVVVVVLIQGWIARQLSLPDSQGIVFILVAAGVWILLCVDRGLLQAHRSYRGLAGNLLIEGGVRTFCVLVLVVAHLGVGGYALGVLLGEGVATVHAHWLASKTWTLEPGPAAVVPDARLRPDSALVRRRLMADVSAAFVGLALLGLLQNVDVILLGRLDHANVGPYAAISVASKALVFGALALGAYLLPEATIRWNEGGHAIRQLGVTLIFLAVPAAVLLVISVFIPRWFLTVVFSAKLSSAAPAFASLVGAMIFLSFSVLITNYLFGTGSRWIVLLAGRRVGTGPGAGLCGRRADRGHGPGRPVGPGGAGPGHGRGLRRHPPEAPRSALVAREGNERTAPPHRRPRSRMRVRGRAARTDTLSHHTGGRPQTRMGMERSEYEAWDRGDRCHSGRGRAPGRGTSHPPGAGPGSARARP